MADRPAMLAIVPTRNRPDAARGVIAAFKTTCTANTGLVFAVDADDPQMAAYAALLDPQLPISLHVNEGEPTMVAALNDAVTIALEQVPNLYAVAFLGDDHRPRTVGWDRVYLNELHKMHTGLVYGDDLYQHNNLPTHVAMTADIPRALGHMAPPELTHLFVDNYWLALGQGADRMRYLPDVIVEHLHPFAGKAQMDEGYARVNAPAMYQHDQDAYQAYAARHLDADIQKVKSL